MFNDDVRPAADANLERWRTDYYLPTAIADGQLVRWVTVPGGTITEKRYPLSAVDSVYVLKRDLWVVDEIVMAFRLGDEEVIVSEDAPGAKEMWGALTRELPGSVPFAQWFLGVAFPAFETNLMEVFSRKRAAASAC